MFFSLLLPSVSWEPSKIPLQYHPALLPESLLAMLSASWYKPYLNL